MHFGVLGPLLATLVARPTYGPTGGLLRLKRFSISNHSRVQDTEVRVGRHLVIVGPNDVGKSSIIRCLDLLLGSSASGLYARITLDDLRNKDEPLIVEATLKDIGEGDLGVFPDELHVDPILDQVTLRVRLEVEADSLGTLTIRRTAPDGGTSRQLSRDQVVQLGWRTLGASHGNFRDFRDDSNASVESILSSLVLGPEEAEFAATAKALQERINVSEVFGKLKNSLSVQVSKALPEDLQPEDISFVSKVSEDLFADVRLVLKVGKNVRSLTEMSDGTRALYAMALYDLATESAHMVAIDEPEIHLHPASQRSLARLLKTGSAQKIVATHSSDVASTFDMDEVLVVRPGGHTVQVPEGFLSEDESLMLRWWVPNKLEPLTSRTVVLVEGISDVVMVRAVGELTNRSIEKLGATLIPIGGGGEVKPVHKLFGPDGFNVDMGILIDRDQVGETEVHVGETESSFASKSIFISEPDLEGEYVRAIGAEAVYAALQRSSLFSKSRLSSCQRSGVGGKVTEDDVSDFCRAKKNKVDAALVAAQLLTSESARRLTSVDSLLSDLVSDKNV